MCLAVPGKIISLDQSDPLQREGKVSFGGIVRKVNLSFVPEAQIGDYVIVHVGFAISQLDQAAAEQTLRDLSEEVDEVCE